MVVFQRAIEQIIKERLFKGRAILLFGPRQAGKTTLSKRLLEPFGEDGAYFNCELSTVRNQFELGKPDLLRSMIGRKKIVVFDEAQTIENIGKILKAFLDTYTDVQVIATGSSSFDLANKINEPLTGRAFEFILYPLSLAELRDSGMPITRDRLEEYLRLGTYPSVVAEPDKAVKEDLLKNIATNYLYKDVFMFESIKNPRVFENLIRMLALQIGSLVSINELSTSLGVSRATVEKYVRLLEQSYVVRVLRTFSRNPRNEIKKAFKVFFLDIGVRNAIIDDVSEVPTRADRGALFENFFLLERLKAHCLHSFSARLLFWRDRFGHEVDVVEEYEGKLRAYECAWSAENHSKDSLRAFQKRYPDAESQLISPDDVVTGKIPTFS